MHVCVHWSVKWSELSNENCSNLLSQYYWPKANGLTIYECIIYGRCYYILCIWFCVFIDSAIKSGSKLCRRIVQIMIADWIGMNRYENLNFFQTNHHIPLFYVGKTDKIPRDKYFSTCRQLLWQISCAFFALSCSTQIPNSI